MEERRKQGKRKKADCKTQKGAKVKAYVDYESMKASILNALLIRIASWMNVPKNEGELVAKACFVKKSLSWEILRNGYKEKLEFQWSNIVGIKATMEEGKPGILQVELSQQPKFYRNLHRDPRKHIQWVDGSDFTEGQALIRRTHLIMFQHGVLDKPFERLISNDKRLFELSKKPFPTSNLIFFPNEEAGRPSQQQPSGSQIHEVDPPQLQQLQPYNQNVRLSPVVGSPIPPRPGDVGFCTPYSNEMIWSQNPLMEILNYPTRATHHHDQLQPPPTHVSVSVAMPLLSSSEAAPRMASSSSSSSVVLGPNVGLVAANVSSQPSPSVERFNGRVMNMRPLQAAREVSNGFLMNRPTYSNIVANGQSSNQPTNLNRVANGQSTNLPTDSNRAANGHFLNGPTNSNGFLMNPPNRVANGQSSNQPITNSNGVANGYLLNGQTNPNGVVNGHLLNSPADSNGILNEYLLNWQTYLNGVLNGHLLNSTVDSNGNLLNWPTDPNEVPNSNLLNRQTNTKGVSNGH